MSRPPSRPERWALALANARLGVDELIALQDEYRDWRDNLPDNLADGATAEMLDASIDLEIDNLDATLSEAEGIDLPRGFGRD